MSPGKAIVRMAQTPSPSTVMFWTMGPSHLAMPSNSRTSSQTVWADA